MIAFIIVMVVGIAGGMYMASQVDQHIDRRTGSKYTQNEKLINNMNKIKTDATTNKKG